MSSSPSTQIPLCTDSAYGLWVISALHCHGSALLWQEHYSYWRFPLSLISCSNSLPWGCASPFFTNHCHLPLGQLPNYNPILLFFSIVFIALELQVGEIYGTFFISKVMYLEIALCRNEIIVLWSKYVGKVFFLLTVHLISCISCMNVTVVWCVAKATWRTCCFCMRFTCSVPVTTVRLLILIGNYSNLGRKQVLIFFLLFKWTWGSLCSSLLNSAALCIEGGWSDSDAERGPIRDAKLSFHFEVQIPRFSLSLGVNSFTAGFPGFLVLTAHFSSWVVAAVHDGAVADNLWARYRLLILPLLWKPNSRSLVDGTDQNV